MLKFVYLGMDVSMTSCRHPRLSHFSLWNVIFCDTSLCINKTSFNLGIVCVCFLLRFFLQSHGMERSKLFLLGASNGFKWMSIWIEKWKQLLTKIWKSFIFIITSKKEIPFHMFNVTWTVQCYMFLFDMHDGRWPEEIRYTLNFIVK